MSLKSIFFFRTSWNIRYYHFSLLPSSRTRSWFLPGKNSLWNSWLNIILQISEQVVHKNDRTYICNRSDTTLFRSIGLVRFHPTGTFESTRAFLPEIIATSAALLTIIIVMFLSHRDEQLDVVGDVVTVRSESCVRIYLWTQIIY